MNSKFAGTKMMHIIGVSERTEQHRIFASGETYVDAASPVIVDIMCAMLCVLVHVCWVAGNLFLK